MYKFFHKNFISYLLLGTLLSSCNSKKENFDLDLSSFKIPKKNNEKILNLEKSDSLVTKEEIIKNELKNYPDKSEILSAVKFGKKDLFSEGDIESTNLDSNLKVIGFLKTNTNYYVFVNYLGNEGPITKESIGGKNTDLLPDGAKVLNIDPENMKLTIEIENDNFTFEF